jgi:signal transduction histidine kinase
MWALLAALVVAMHGVSFYRAAILALPGIVAAALLGFGVHRLTEHFPWPRRVTPLFVIGHVAAALMFAIAWILLNSALESAHRGVMVFVLGIGLGPFIVTGVWFYVMIAGVSYTAQATQRAAQAEAAAAQAQLAAIRSQLNPHFLFNALHTVIQLIPREPRRAAQAAEGLADVLRATVDENRDLVTVAEELAFVEKYLDVERLRFGDRLRVVVDVSGVARAAILPSFALQTLVENAVRHGAAPRVEPTDLTVTGLVANGMLRVTVSDNGVGAAAQAVDGTGTGLKRLRDRLAALYGKRARLDIAAASAAGGFAVDLFVPQESPE